MLKKRAMTYTTELAAGTGFYPTSPLGPEKSHNLKFAKDLSWKELKQTAEGKKQECAN